MEQTSENKRAENLYEKWFLDYASYVILDRAIPDSDDGLKPVQRRLLHAMSEMEDGRYNKAANIIGHTMRYHPHGDMAISDALVKLTQKGLLIDPQGNWGNPVTGDNAAAARYIEARLTPFAKRVVFNKNITETNDSYDGRHKEPIKLPIKFPLLTFLGTEGIAVGLSTKILPHNFCELIKESIAALKGHRPQLFPDFFGGGSADFREYKDGRKGGRVKVRAKINVISPKLLCITEIPFGTTTTSLIESIVSANEKNKIKIKRIEDNTAKDIEIIVHLASGTTPDQVIAGLFAFTDCEVSIAPNCCVITDKKPRMCGVGELVSESANRTKVLLQKELEFNRRALLEKLHLVILEKIFVKEKIYRKIEKAESWEKVLSTTKQALSKFSDKLIRPLEDNDLPRLLEMRIKKISKFDLDITNELIKKLKNHLKDIDKSLRNITQFTINYYQELLKDYGKEYPRKTKIETFGKVKVTKAAISHQKMYIDYKEGFVGTSLKDAELLGEASEFTEVMTLNSEGQIMVHRITDKTFVGKKIIHAEVFKSNERCIFHLIYRDGRDGSSYAKRFDFTSYTRARGYDLTRGNKGSKVLYFSVNPNGESEKVKISLKASPLLKKARTIQFDFSKLAIKSRKIIGEEVTEHKIDKITQAIQGASTLAAERVWYDRNKKTLNRDGVGIYLGKYSGEEKLVALYKSGSFEILNFDWDHLFSPDLMNLCFKSDDLILTSVYFDSERKDTFVKRVSLDEFDSGRHNFISADGTTKLLVATFNQEAEVEAKFLPSKRKTISSEQIKLAAIVEVKGLNAIGNKLHRKPLKSLKLL